jgi:Fe-S oxidoreductase
LTVRIIIGLIFTFAAFAIGGRRLYWLFKLIKSGRKDTTRKSAFVQRIMTELVEVIGQKKLLKKKVAGFAHAITFWGFLILGFTILEAWGDLFNRSFAIPLIGHWEILGFFEDLFMVMILVALLVFTAIRLSQNPKRIERKSRFYGSHTDAAWLVLLMISGVMISLWLYRAAQVNTGHFPYGWGAFASHLLAKVLHPMGTGVNSVIETVALLANVGIICAFLVLVVYSKHLHIFLAPINVAFSRRPRALGELAYTPDLDPENMDENTVFGAGYINELSWKQLLDLATCTECGRCQEQCPAWNTGKPLSPKLLIMSLRDSLFSSADTLLASTRKTDESNKENDEKSQLPALVPDVIEKDILWSCTTCGACVEQCPVDIEHVDTILDMRRYQVLMESDFPTEAGTMLRNIENRGDPWGLGSSQRTQWTAGLNFEIPVISGEIPEDVQYLFWVGCAGALDERARKTTQSVAKLLHQAGISFAILGQSESCTGDPARRLGNEYLFQMQAMQNIETLNAANVKTIVASCPHCFNALANEYPALGGNYEVIHHSQLLAVLIEQKKINAGTFEAKVTYHDPCYLGRHNRIFDEPRSVLESIDGVTQIEMHRHKEKGFCCGAGGARMWLEENIGERINMNRTAEAIATGADVVSTACPFCMIMLDDAVKAYQKADDVKVMDVAQILENSSETLSVTQD